MNPEIATTGKKRYTAPKLNNLASEKAKILLLDKATQGDQQAKDFLDLMLSPPKVTWDNLPLASDDSNPWSLVSAS